MKKVGLVGWRGMVGSVLMQRMQEEKDFEKIIPTFFSHSKKGALAPVGRYLVEDSENISFLLEMDIIITCQGSKYTENILPKVRSLNWKGFWIDASSFLRMDRDSIIVLDPINSDNINNAIRSGFKNFVGANFTVSLLMMAIHGLLESKLVNYISSMSYQAISGAGSRAMRELLDQSLFLNKFYQHEKNVLDLESEARSSTKMKLFPKKNLLSPLCMNVLPWIDKSLPNGQTKEEWKAQKELNKILENDVNLIKVDGLCERVPTLRSHSQSLLIELNQEVSIPDLESIIKNANPWIRYVPNNRLDTLDNLTPMAVSGTLDIAVGRLKRSNTSRNHINLFVVGDQLLWGAAEPLRRLMNVLLQK